MTSEESVSTQRPLLSVRGLTVDYATDRPVRAVNDLSFDLQPGEILGLAGESGSGKSTLITALLQLQRPPAETVAGEITYFGRSEGPIDLRAQTERQLSQLRWRELAIVFQSAMDSLNPVMRLKAQFGDVLRGQLGLGRREAQQRTGELLRMVGVPADRMNSYPSQLSGGMRQRAGIALALACKPKLVVMDEPTTAVDVVMQRQILRQVKKLQSELGFAIIFVTHDLSLLVELADRIGVMYAGQLVELSPAKDVYLNPLHPYTQGLRDSFPPLHGERRPLRGIGGTPPDLRALPTGCSFRPRCGAAMSECAGAAPALVADGERSVACFLHHQEIQPDTSTELDQEEARVG